ncbi:hypothetical protein [Psychromonas sp. SP041]|uniref:hypothetical protein n=1 Tax=Psychromonas sp. SP041 TaxID=1365007 RepID=UPI000472D999|nr:hypothetical protein [Psychromonas sp. SP041]
MNKQKTITALIGTVAIISSVMSTNEIMAYGLVALGATITSLMLTPILSITINPVVERLLSTKLGRLLGNKGRIVCRILFTVPSLSKKRKA